MVYLLIENQSSPDSLMALRLYSYMYQIWEAEKRTWQDSPSPRPPLLLHPVVPIVLYTGTDRWTSSISLAALMQLPEALTDFVPQFKVLFLSLRDMASDALTETGSAVAWILRILQSAEAPFNELAEVLEEVIINLEKLPQEAQAEWARAIHFLLLFIRHRREWSEQAFLNAIVSEAVEDRHKQEVTEIMYTGAQKLRDEGRVEGRKEGREEGLLEGRRLMLLESLETKFGALSPEIMETVYAMSGSQISDINRHIFSAQSLADLGL